MWTQCEAFLLSPIRRTKPRTDGSLSPSPGEGSRRAGIVSGRVRLDAAAVEASEYSPLAKENNSIQTQQRLAVQLTLPRWKSHSASAARVGRRSPGSWHRTLYSPR